MKEGIVLLAHGSRDPEWSRPFELIAASVAQRRPAAAVALAYLEHGPSLEEAVRALGAKGALSIRVVPLLLGQGGHAKEDLPRLFAQAKGAHPALALVLERTLGEQPAVVEAIAAAIAAGR